MHELGMGEREHALGVEEQVMVGRGEIHGPRHGKVALLRLRHLERGAPPENARHQAAMARVEVLDHDDGRRKVRRQRNQHLAERIETAGGRRHGDDLKLRCAGVHFECSQGNGK
jgi:hypothetical protein